MAVSHYSIRSENLQLRVLLCLLIFLFCCCPTATPLSFEFPSFNQTITPEIITREGNASIDTRFLRLTNSAQDEHQGGTGRAYYTQPFLLRENATGKLADFTTNFTFSISVNAPNDSNAGDGLAFFLAPNGSKLNVSAASGGVALGLPFYQEYPFVAVEFDIYMNINERTSDTNKTVDDQSEELYGIDGDHVGIDVNSIKSSKALAWNGSIVNGENNDVQISYNSSTKNLSVAFTTFVSDGKKKMSYLSYRVDLEQKLPDWVVVGFSASTGAAFALHKIVSWSFTSTPLFVKDNTPVSVSSVPAPSPVASSITSTNSSSGNKGLVVGLGIGASIILVGGLGLVWFILLKKKETMDSDEDPMVGDAIDTMNSNKGLDLGERSKVEEAQMG